MSGSLVQSPLTNEESEIDCCFIKIGFLVVWQPMELSELNSVVFSSGKLDLYAY